MSYEKMMAAGAEAAGGQVYINRVALAYFGDNGFTLTEAGERWLAEHEQQEPAKPKKAPKAAKQEAAAESSDPLADLDNL